jgi:ParB family chromosome partitioning protein
LVSGERRFRASKLAGLKTIPAFIRIANDRESLEMALVENIQRRDLDPIEIALSYERLLKEIDLTQSQLSSRIGKNRSTIANYLRLLKLDPIIQTGMRDGFLSMGHGRCLISLENTDAQIKVYETVVAENLSVRETEELVRNKESKTKKSTKKTSPLPKPVLKTKKDFAEFFGAKVDVKMSKKGNGRFVIPFSSEEDMERLAKLINGES